MMSIKDSFINCIDAEYKDFMKFISRFTTQEVFEEAEYVASFKKLYDYLKTKQDISDEKMKELTSMQTPIHSFCRQGDLYYGYRWSLMPERREYIDEMNDVPDGTKQLWENLFNIMSKEVEESKQESKDVLFSELVKKGPFIGDYSIKTLIQFKQPLQVLMEQSSLKIDIGSKVNETIMSLELKDVLMLPYEFIRENIKPELYLRHDTACEINSLIPIPDKDLTLKWLELYRDVYEDADNPYDFFLEEIKRIKTEFGDDIIQKVYDLGRTCVIPDYDLGYVAKYLSLGGNENDYKTLIHEREIEDVVQEMEQGGQNMC